MSRRRNLALIVGFPALAVVVAALLILRRPEPPRSPPPARIPTVEVAPVRSATGPIPVEGNGTVRPRAEVELAPQVSGRVVWVNPAMVSGGRFRRGQTLVQLDQADFVNRVDQARAQVAQDSVALLEAEEESRIARQEFERFQERQGVRVAPGPLVLREPQLQAARAALARSLAQLADAELALSRTRVRAPFDGVVRSESVDPGAFANVGQALGRVYASDAVEVLIPVTDRDAAMIPGLWSLEGRVPAAATVLAEYAGRRYAWDGYVERVETALDEQSRTIDLVVRVDDPFRPGTPVNGDAPMAGQTAPPLLVGQFVQVRIQGLEGAYHVIPRRALRAGDETWVVADSAVRIVPLEVLQQLQDSVFVSGDLRPGDAVILAGVNAATEGMRVRPASGGN